MVKNSEDCRSNQQPDQPLSPCVERARRFVTKTDSEGPQRYAIIRLPAQLSAAQLQVRLNHVGLADQLLCVFLEEGSEPVHQKREAEVQRLQSLTQVFQQRPGVEISRQWSTALTASAESVRLCAQKLLREVRPIEQLCQDLDDPAPDRQELAALALGTIGRPARAAINQLIRNLSSENDEVRKASAWALEQIYKSPPAHELEAVSMAETQTATEITPAGLRTPTSVSNTEPEPPQQQTDKPRPRYRSRFRYRRRSSPGRRGAMGRNQSASEEA